MSRIYFCIPERLNRFCVQNHLLNLCSSAVKSQRLLCSQEADVKCSYQSILFIYKNNYFGLNGNLLFRRRDQMQESQQSGSKVWNGLEE